MKRFILILFTLHLTLNPVPAQPSWAKKASKSVFILKTFSADGALLGSSNGFFIGNNGEAISSLTPFIGAAHAVVIDPQGKESQVDAILGANEMYDVVKFRVDNTKTLPLTLSPTPAPVGSLTWVLPYREMRNLPNGQISKAEKFQTDYDYYTVAITLPEQLVGCPLMNANGEVIGLIQPSANSNDTLSYAIGARFAEDQRISGLTYNAPLLQNIHIRKELPNDLTEANLAVYMTGSRGDSVAYAKIVDDFVRQFPDVPDGYTYRAQIEADRGDFAAADQDMNNAIRLSKQKDEAHFAFGRIIYNKEIYQADIPYSPWSLDKALQEVQTASELNEQPTYRQLEAEILFAQKRYDEAYQIFKALTTTSLRGAETFYSAARCKEMLNDTTAMLALMDSMVATFTQPYLKEAAPYIWARAEARRQAGKYRDAISDMNDYELLMTTEVNDNFYYIRHLTEIEARLYQQALNDINRAIQIRPQETLYYAEKASLLVRVGHLDDAIITANECITLAPDNSDGYLFLGLAQCLKGDRQQGLSNLHRAQELGEPQAQALIEKYQ